MFGTNRRLLAPLADFVGVEFKRAGSHFGIDAGVRVGETLLSERADPVDVAIEYLETLPKNRFDENVRIYGQKLGGDLRGFLGLADSTLTEIFDTHPKPVSRAMTLFVLRGNIEDLLEFKNEKLTEAKTAL